MLLFICIQPTAALQVLVLAARSIAEHTTDDPEPHVRAQQLLLCLDDWARQHPQPDAAEVGLWRELQGITWCPVLVKPPETGLPWPHPIYEQSLAELETAGQPAVEAAGGATEQQQQHPAQHQRVLRMPPKMVAPAEMAWLVSGPLRLLAAPGPGKELAALLGWQPQQVLRPAVAMAQLMALGEMYPAGQVRPRWPGSNGQSCQQ